MANGWSPLGKTYYEIFLYLFPMHWVEDVLLAKTNTALRAIKFMPIELREFGALYATVTPDGLLWERILQGLFLEALRQVDEPLPIQLQQVHEPDTLQPHYP